MIRYQTIIAVSMVVFVLAFYGAKIVFRTSGNHTWHRAHVELKHLQMGLDIYFDECGEYPDEEVVNSWLDYIWSNEGDINHLHIRDDFEYLSVMYNDSTYHRLNRWGRPRYIVSDGIPGGRGFYTVGDDGLTTSDGNDPDDINSWDVDSISYYYKRLWRRRYITYAIIALVVSLGAAFILGWIRHKQKQAQQVVAPDS